MVEQARPSLPLFPPPLTVTGISPYAFCFFRGCSQGTFALGLAFVLLGAGCVRGAVSGFGGGNLSSGAWEIG